MKLQPTLDRVIILKETQETKSAGGIIIPGETEKETNFGTVVAVGPGGFNMDGSLREISVKVKDKVFFTNYYTTLSGSKMVVVADEDVLAIVKD